MSLSNGEILYVAAVVLIGGYALVRTLTLLRSARRSRVKLIEKRRRFEAVPTETPIDHPKEVSLERGLESIESHFTVMRRLLVPTIVAITVLLAVVPFVAETSASIVAAILAVLAGLALRPFLENAVSGMVISLSRLVRIGDTVRVDDWYGTVEDITATHTAVKVWDWRRYLVPNSRMLQSAFFNYSLFDTYQWAHVEFWVAPDADIDEVKALAVEIPSRSSYFNNKEEPAFWVIRIERDAVCCWLAAWADTPSAAWALANDVRTDLLREFRRRDIPLVLQRHRWLSEPPCQGRLTVADQHAESSPPAPEDHAHAPPESRPQAWPNTGS